MENEKLDEIIKKKIAEVLSPESIRPIIERYFDEGKWHQGVKDHGRHY